MTRLLRPLSVPAALLLLVTVPLFAFFPAGFPSWRAASLLAAWAGYGLLLASLLLMLREVERRTGKPAAFIETDLVDPRYFSAANVKNRLESYFQMIKQKKAAPAKKAAAKKAAVKKAPAKKK